MAKKKRVRVEEEVEDDFGASTSTPTKQGTGSWPLPRSTVADPDQWIKYSPHGYLAFVNGDDPHFKPQAQHWARVSPNLAPRALYDEEDGKVSLPRVTFPPNLVWGNRDQRYKFGARRPVHGGFSWPGHPAPRYPTREQLIKGLPQPLRDLVRKITNQKK